MKRGTRGEKYFRWRGQEVSRVEGLSDAVFAFAVTLLVVSLDVPRTFADLMATMRGFPAFALCFAMLIMIWHYHYQFFRRYGLADLPTIGLNAMLLFLVLFYVYPLKFLFSWLTAGSPSTITEPGGAVIQVIDGPQIRTLMWIYSAGFVAIFLLLALMNLRAYRMRDAFGLDEMERMLSWSGVRDMLIMASIGAVSLLIAVFAPPAWVGAAGLVYVLTGPVMAIHGVLVRRSVDRLVAAGYERAREE